MQVKFWLDTKLYYQQNSYIISILRKLDNQKISDGTARSNSSSIQTIIYICSRHDDKVTNYIQIVQFIHSMLFYSDSPTCLNAILKSLSTNPAKMLQSSYNAKYVYVTSFQYKEIVSMSQTQIL